MSSSSEAGAPLDAEQLALDLEDAYERLGTLRRAIQARDDARETVQRLSSQLRQAKRRAKETDWDLACLIGSEKRRPAR